MANRYPFSPFPDGWFFVCHSRELPRGKVFSKTFMGKEIVAFRGEQGEVCVADAHCPHLGAHMGKKGACIEGDAIRCPFHGFRFDTSGKCVSTPYGEPPKAAKLTRWHVQEVNSFIFAYHDNEGREPSWRLPTLEDEGWTSVATRQFRLRGHPQETTENGVDPAHLSLVHGYRNLEPWIPVTIEGPYLTGGYKMNRSAGPLDHLNIKLDAQFQVHVWGLGYSMVETHVPHIGMVAQKFIFATPSDGEMIDLYIGARVRDLAHPERALPGLQKVPAPLLTRVVRRLVLEVLANDINQDFDIWQNKGYVVRPALSKGDGPIGQYRRYCRQFYPELRVKQDAAAE